mmetsp:Transcript_22858/g.27635  ORF Transcript_22858/g.27635 Transcript_22858/m.27635 type:complete len:201 (+) Transcript_22858:125-727(+)
MFRLEDEAPAACSLHHHKQAAPGHLPQTFRFRVRDLGLWLMMTSFLRWSGSVCPLEQLSARARCCCEALEVLHKCCILTAPLTFKSSSMVHWQSKALLVMTPMHKCLPHSVFPWVLIRVLTPGVLPVPGILPFGHLPRDRVHHVLKIYILLTQHIVWLPPQTVIVVILRLPDGIGDECVLTRALPQDVKPIECDSGADMQ